MFKCRISDALTSKRLDATYYNPIYLKDDHHLANWKQATLDSLRAKNAPIVYGVLKPDVVVSNYYLAKAECFDGMFVDVEGCETISKSLFFEFKRSQVERGDILIAIGGYVGRPAIVQELPDRVFLNINRHLARFRADQNSINPYFIIAYLASTVGERQLVREVTGSVQPGINLEDLREIPIPIPSNSVQTYIGDKVQQAERLRKQSNYLIAGSRLIVEALIEETITEEELHKAYRFFQKGDSSYGEEIIEKLKSRGSIENVNAIDQLKSKRTNRVKARLLDPDRVDPDYYHPQHLDDEEILRKFGAEKLGRVGKFFTGPFGSKLPSSLYLSQGVPLFRVGNVGAMKFEPSGMAYLAPSVHSSLSASEVVSGDLLIVKASVGEKICKVPESISKANITQHIIAIRPNNNFDIDYIATFLFCAYGKRQLIRRSLGSIIQYLGVDDARTVLFPKIDGTLQNYIGDMVRQGLNMNEHSECLTSAAKFLVKALIEGNLKESELKAAQEKLRQGDNSLDHEILSQLTRKGYNVSGEPPLFPDLDSLYEVLKEAETSQEVE
jgi:type I restriction enzyme, S subunit